MQYEIGFIGCGNMGGALAQAVAKTVCGKKIALCDFDTNKVLALQEIFGGVRATAKDIAHNAKFIVIGVKPQVAEDALKEISEILKNRTGVTVITMMAGVSISAVQKMIGKDLPVIRIMPNTPAMLGAGMILYACKGVDEETEKAFLTSFAKAGVFDKLPEDKIDAGSALSGCGPAFVYAFAEALADAGVECGLPRDKALLYASQTLLGASEMLLKFGHPADLKDAVCSPGGTTIAGIHALEKAGFRGATMEAVLSAYKRTLELKK